MTAYAHAVVSTTEAYQVFFQALQFNNLDRLVEVAYDFFKLPVLVTDENYKLISQHPRQKIGVDIWDTLLEKKVLPLETVKSYQREYLDNYKQHYEPFYADSGLVGNCPRIFAEVYTDDQIIGHAALFMFDQPLYPEDLACVKIFTDALKLLLVRRRSREQSTFSAYLRDLLNQESPLELRLFAANSLSESIPGAYSIMAMPIGEGASHQAFATMILSDIPNIYRSVVSTIWDGHFVALFGLMRGDTYTEREIEFFGRVFHYISPAASTGGISQPFHDLNEARGRFLQASITARLTTRPYDFFDQLFPTQIFDFVCQQNAANFFIHPVLEALLSYDAQNGTDYFRTLKVYSLFMHNKEMSAASLCIHRNTLLYRLNRIQEIFHLPYDEPKTALALLNSFQLWQVAQKYEKPNKDL